MIVNGFDLYLNPTEATVARSLGFQLEEVGAGDFYELLTCHNVNHRDRVRDNIMRGVSEHVESEWRATWNIEAGND